MSLKDRNESDVDYVVIGPRHEAFHLNPRMLLHHVFPKILLKCYSEKLRAESLEGKDISFSLVGLHCCGDLGPTALRLFSMTPSCRALLLIGCCYMKLSTECDEEHIGYPLSKFVRSRSNNSLSYTAREMACHAIEAYARKLEKGADDLKVHSYRAVLEELIVRNKPELKHSGLRSVKKAHNLSFEDYAARALGRLHGAISFTEEELTTPDVTNKLQQWMKVVIYYSMRLMLAPAVEALVLLDRLFYIKETTNSRCHIVPIFDPIISPRNYAVIAQKENRN